MLKRLALAYLPVVAAGAVQAQTAPQGETNGVRTVPKWELGLGGFFYTLPDYRGADHQSSGILPFPYFYYRGDIIKADRGGVRGELYASDRLDLELSFSGNVPVNSDKNEARRGMPDLDPALEVGPQGIVRIFGRPTDTNRLDIRLPVRQVIGMEFGGVNSNFRSRGQVFTSALNFSHTPRKGWNFGAQAGLYFATKTYHQYLYGVDQQYATANRPAYEARGGYGGWQLTTAISRRFDKLWVGAYVRGSSVNGATFDDSPLVRRKYNYSAGFGIAWVFKESAERVVARDEEQ
ncbi:MipA/OmpV family protein [Viridibacterium curvum]|uniref:MipA/OmpV family protein n=1 Tax=Viridibacterium curvum TaxID=1101404 RepID=A0ABP9QZP5_9RHOO